MRGAFTVTGIPVVTLRITPAHAGSIHCHRDTGGNSEDHPRACGEHSCSGPHSVWLSGSPPRMRGAYLSAYLANTDSRITPAHAGSMYTTASPQSPGWDHPRACGEHLPGRHAHHMGTGSPPRMRGAYSESTPVSPCAGITPAHAGSIIFSLQKKFLDRITPAHAGSMPNHRLQGLSTKDHPRACGEHGSPKSV